MKLLQSGHGKLARQMTLLMAFCDYIGNCIKVKFCWKSRKFVTTKKMVI